MASLTSFDLAARPATWPRLAPFAARVLQVGWVALLIGAFAVAFAATPAMQVRYRTTCPQIVCDILPQPNAQTVQLLARLDIPLDAYARFMVGVEWVALLVWSALAALLVWKRPRDSVALLLAYGGIIGASKAFLDALSDAHPDVVLPARIGLLVSAIVLPLIVALFPDGRWVPRWARWIALAAIVYGVALVLAGNPPPALLAALDLPLGAAPLLVLLGAQLYRYRRVSTVVQRQQAKWVIFALGGYLANVAVGSLAFTLGIAAPYQLAFVALCYGCFLALGLAVTVAILRFHLFAIDIMLNRALVYGGLTALLVGLYVLIVGAFGTLIGARHEPATALLASGAIAVLFAPLRERVQRAVNRLLYGERDEPYAALSRLGQRLEGTLAATEILPAIAGAITEALRLPYATIVLEGDEVAPAGAGTADVLRLPLVYQQAAVGELLVAPRGPGEDFSLADRRLLGDLARQIGVAAHAVRLTAEVQRARERLVAAREEERRRLRRDLHDGLGSQLAALALQAGALRLTISRDPDAAAEQAAELRGELQAAVADIRRLVHGLRPPALDELGLVGALRQRASCFDGGGLDQFVDGASQSSHAPFTVTVSAPETLPPLPAAIEVAVYRIVDEAVTNVTRHAAAHACLVRLDASVLLTLTIEDDGLGIAPDRPAGVGLLSMRERAEELGGSFSIAPCTDGPGTHLTVTLPLPTLTGDTP